MKRFKQVNCPECNLLCSAHKLEPHMRGSYCWGSEYKIETQEDYDLWVYWKGKKNNSIKGQCAGFILSPLELISLLREAEIRISDVGNGKGKYNLSRHKDTGIYEAGNCRFIPQIDNIMEKEYGLRYVVDGVTYSDTRVVSEKLKCGRSTVRRRCESSKFPNWKLITL
jgi:hypothetical protein